MKLFKIFFPIFFFGISLICLAQNDTQINNNNPIIIDPLSIQSLKLEQCLNSQVLGTATGFIVQKNNKNYLITNWHVVSGRNPSTYRIENKQGLLPNKLGIWHNGNNLGEWHREIENLYKDNNVPRWIEHDKGRAIDVVALELENITNSIKIYSFDLELSKANMVPEIAMPVSIIGFPLDLTGSGLLPIWKVGHIASEPNVDYDNKPVFLIDATTRGGMSGSPVILRLSGGYRTKDGGNIMAIAGYQTLFLGVYSGHWIMAEIGLVWKPQVIYDILNGL